MSESPAVSAQTEKVSDGIGGLKVSSGSKSDPLETARWTRYLPEAFGIRDSIRESSYRWCVREGGMWGIATGTAMSLHRMRMGSRPVVAGHFFFGTMMVVMLPSYYFCYRRREHQEQVIEMMMQYNQFGHASDLPEEPPLEEHPFWQQNENGMNTLDAGTKHDREFRGMIKERKEWQKKQDPSFDKIFQEKQ
uniref:Cytochrome c oxidase assembly protein COX20, mitochondrial n=1 Tax=Pseudo-nitzschia delicatissima TaxID=44447 RepID=A0A7S0XJS0_9STRA|mmetsp:Transcript_1204/g.2733  ORF Transcript_1204/g.2733 Transcript_1204/m.2733 type:complete len:192 (+) Transcript_1204:187-762(+)